jgi:hypothetical protein
LSAAQKFLTRPAPFLAVFRFVVIALGGAIIAATVLGQLKAGRFPAYDDLAISIVLPFAIYGVLTLVVLVGRHLYSIKVTPTGITGYGAFGQKIEAPWNAMQEVSLEAISDVPYIFVKIEGCKSEMTIPLWLENLTGFFAAVRQHTPPENPLHQFIRDAAEHGLDKEPVPS